ncbi:MAG: T9SS type A sorting domain-containing protein [Candidatus Kapabacteria bacterium]|nr:T9SS type A sorting domain-containing protein [Candidatus Kapabacteria bacterium]
MKRILTSISILAILLSCTNTKASEPVWEIIKLTDDEYTGHHFEVLSSFESDHLFAARSMIHIFVKDRNPIPLIKFTDWDTYLHDVSYKSNSAIVTYGWYFNFVTHPLTEYSIVFYVIPRDTILDKYELFYEWETHWYDQGVFGNHKTIYSSVNAEGNGILVLEEWSQVKKLTNWEMTDFSSISGYTPLFGVFHKDTHFVVCKAKNAGNVLMKSNTGAEWVFVGEIAGIDDTREQFFNKLLILNDLEFYVIGEKGFYYSKDAGQSWKYLKVTENKINGADFRNESELILCGNNGFLCKVNVQNYETMYFESLTNQNLLSIHFSEPNVGWAGGEHMTLLKYSTPVNVEEQIGDDLSDLRIMPIPASDYVDIYVGDELFDIENNTVEIISPFGIVMTKQNIDIRSENSMLKRLDISKFPQGIYFVKFGNKIKKFIKI